MERLGTYGHRRRACGNVEEHLSSGATSGNRENACERGERLETGGTVRERHGNFENQGYFGNAESLGTGNRLEPAEPSENNSNGVGTEKNMTMFRLRFWV